MCDKTVLVNDGHGGIDIVYQPTRCEVANGASDCHYSETDQGSHYRRYYSKQLNGTATQIFMVRIIVKQGGDISGPWCNGQAEAVKLAYEKAVKELTVQI